MRWVLMFVSLIPLACSSKSSTSDSGVDSGTDPRPPAICHEGPMGSAEAFVNATEEAGFAALDAIGFYLTVADLDGDGYADLVVKKNGTSQRDTHVVYHNVPHPTLRGRRAFVEWTGTGIDLNRRTGITGRAASFHQAADVDNDGDMDLFAASYFQDDASDLLDRQEILLNDGTGHFSLIAGGSSVATPERPTNSAAAFLDFDRDGKLDLFVADWYKNYGLTYEANQARLYHGLGDGTFSEVTEAAKLMEKAEVGQRDSRKPAYGASACDLDGDGYPDLMKANYGRQWNDLYLNLGNGTFENIAESAHVDGDDNHDFHDNQMWLCWCKFHPNDCTLPTQPQIDCSQSAWSADDENPFRLNGNTWELLCADYDRDGDLDLLSLEVAHGWAGQSSDRTQILQNNGKRGRELAFTRLSGEQSGVNRPRAGAFWNEGDIWAAWMDYDNDGLVDLLIHEGAYPENRLYLFRQQVGGTFKDVALLNGLDLPNPGAAAVADFDLDGDLDIVTTVVPGKGTWTKGSLLYFRNQLGEHYNWIRIDLKGAGPPDGSNRMGMGAWVKVASGGKTQMWEVSGGDGRFGNQKELSLTFGLGRVCDDVDIEVRWPNKALTIQRFEKVRANYRVRLTEGSDKVEYLGI